LTVLNAGAAEANATVKLQAETVSVVDCSGARRIAAGTAGRVTIKCSGLKGLHKPMRGQLVVTGSGVPTAHQIDVKPALKSADWAIAIIASALAIAVVIVACIWFWACYDAERKQRFRGRAPGPKWDFDTSWATTLTTVGALLATVLTAITYPDAPHHIDKDTVVALSALFGAMVVVAPFLFQAWRHKDAPVAGPGSTLWGSNRILLLCCGLTFAAVLGQLATGALLCQELTDDGAAGWVATGVATALALGATRYFIVTAARQADTDWKAITDAAEADTEMVGPEGAPSTSVIVRPPSDVRWSLP
jgi:hypothetical protein